MARLYDKYKQEVIPQVMEKFGFKNRLQTPRLVKIVINMGIGEGAHDVKVLDQACAELALITGQRPQKTFAKRAIAAFKIRAGSPVGCKVTLRGMKMYEFLDRLVNVVLPRVRDFRGLDRDSFDGSGNYTFGVSEQTIFPEIDIDKVQRMQGMDITIVTSTASKEESHELLRLLGMPFKK